MSKNNPDAAVDGANDKRLTGTIRFGAADSPNQTPKPVDKYLIKEEPPPAPSEQVSATPEFTGRTLKRHSLNSINAGLAQCDVTDPDACFYKKTEVDRHINRLAAILEERERELAEAKRERDAAQRVAHDNMHLYQTAEARAAELQARIDVLDKQHEADCTTMRKQAQRLCDAESIP